MLWRFNKVSNFIFEDDVVGSAGVGLKRLGSWVRAQSRRRAEQIVNDHVVGAADDFQRD